MKTLILIIVFSTFIVSIHAQEVVSSAGGTNTIGEYEVSWTLGEPVIETVSSGETTLTQGFQQSKLVITDVISFNDNIQVSMYPNPTDDLVNIDIKGLASSEIMIGVYTIDGQLLKQQHLDAGTSILNLHGLASGSYLFKVTDENNPIKTFKLVKR